MKKEKLSRDISLFAQSLKQFDNEHPDELMPMSTDAQFAMNCLHDCFLGPDHYFVNPLGNVQANTEILYFILWRHSKQFRREIRDLYGRKKFKLKPWMKKVIFTVAASIITMVIILNVLFVMDWFVNHIS